MIRIGRRLRFAAALIIAGLAGPYTTRAMAADNLIAEWSTLKMPPPPQLKPVTVDPKTTALFLFDFMNTNCNKKERPRCVAAIPTLKALHDKARAAGMMIQYTLPGGGKPVEPSIGPRQGEVVTPGGGPDKFYGSDLDQRLKAHGITAVIVCGTSAQGVGIGTGSAAVQRGYKVIYPIDCLPSESAFREAYAAYHMAGGGPPVTTKSVTVTRSDMIKF